MGTAQAQRERMNRPRAPAGLLIHWQSSSGPGRAGPGQGSREPVQGVGTGAPEQCQPPSSCFNALWFPFSTSGFYHRHSYRWVPSLQWLPDHSPLHWADRLQSSCRRSRCPRAHQHPPNPQRNILDKPMVSKVGTKGATLARVLRTCLCQASGPPLLLPSHPPANLPGVSP